jgi:hypothetical protein
VKENTLEVCLLNPNVYITVCAWDVTEISVLKQLWMFEVLVFWITPSVQVTFDKRDDRGILGCLMLGQL